MFLTLGLLVSPKELLPTIVPGIVISVVMMAHPKFNGDKKKYITFAAWKTNHYI